MTMDGIGGTLWGTGPIRLLMAAVPFSASPF
jgi:hypothetical protein